MAFWQLMASIDTIAPRKSSSASRSGIAAIALDFSATTTQWTAGFAPSRLPRTALPSTPICSSVNPSKAAVAQAVKAALEGGRIDPPQHIDGRYNAQFSERNGPGNRDEVDAD